MVAKNTGAVAVAAGPWLGRTPCGLPSCLILERHPSLLPSGTLALAQAVLVREAEIQIEAEFLVVLRQSMRLPQFAGYGFTVGFWASQSFHSRFLQALPL